MLSLSFYKVVHLLGVVLLFSALGAVAAATAAEADARIRKVAGMAHGTALVLLLVAGFGLVARNGFTAGWPLWVWLKIGLWLLLGAAPIVVRKAGRAATWMIVVLPLLGALAAWLALYRVGG